MTSPPGQDEPQSQRDYLRLDLGVLGFLETLEGRKRVEVVDLSQGGAHVVVLDEAGADNFVVRECVLRWMEFEAFGEVKRREGRHFGIAFDEPLRPGTIKETRRRASLNKRNDHYELKQAARMWSKGIFPS